MAAATSQPERNDIQSDMIKIERANTDIQVKLYENLEHLKTVQSLCDKATAK